MSFSKLLLGHLALGSLVYAQDQSTCSADSPCKQGCCNQYGNCGFGPDFCSSDVCISTCDAVAECGQYAAAGNELCPLNVCCSQYGFCGTTEDFCDDGCQNGCAAVNEPSCGGSSSAQRYIGYYESFNLQHACDTVRPSAIDANVWTHLNYAFALIGSDGTLTTMNDNDPELYAEFVSLKDQNPSLRTFLAVGGWDAGGKVFSDMVAHTFTRRKFINSAISTMQQYGFDGIDIDWEYPVADDRGGMPADKENFVQFLKELKAACGTQYGLTATIPSSYWYMRGFDIVGMAQHIDWFNFMSYDIHGTWDGDSPYTQRVVNPHTNLTDIATGLDLLWRNNIDPGQVCLGLGFYGRSFTLSDPSCNTPGCPFAGNGGGSGGGIPGECTGVSGTLSDYEMARILASDSPDRVYDAEAGVNWMTWNTNQWVSFDDGKTLNQKAAFANGKCMGGTFAWAVDLGGPGSLQDPNTLGPNDMGLGGAGTNGTGGGQNSTGNGSVSPGSATIVTTTDSNGQPTTITKTLGTSSGSGSSGSATVITTTNSNGQPTTITKILGSGSGSSGSGTILTTTDSNGQPTTITTTLGTGSGGGSLGSATVITTTDSNGQSITITETLVPVTTTNAQGSTITSTSTDGAVIPPNGGQMTSSPTRTSPSPTSLAPTSTSTIGPGPVSTNGHCQGPDCKDGRCTGLLCVAIGCTGSDCDGSGNCLGPACRKIGCIGPGCTDGRCTGDNCQTSGCVGSDCDSDSDSDDSGICFGLSCISLGCNGLDCGTSGLCTGPDCAEVSCTGTNCVRGSCTGPGCTSTGSDSGGDSECDEPETADDCTITVSSYVPTSATTYTTTRITHCTTITACEVTPLTTTTTTTRTSSSSQPFCTPNCPGCDGGTKRRRSLDSPSRLRVTRRQGPSKRSFEGPKKQVPSSNVTAIAKRTMPFAPGPARISSYYNSLTGNSRTVVVEHLSRGLAGQPSSKMITFGNADQYVLVGGLVGCTSVIVTSRRGAYVSHLWERPAFDALEGMQPTFQQDVINFLQNDLGNTANQGGIFADGRTTKVFIMTPAPFDSDINTDQPATLTNGNNPMKYGAMYNQIIGLLQNILPNNVPITPFVYQAQREQDLTRVPDTAYGKAVLLFSNNQENDPSNAGREYDVPKSAWQCVMQAAKMGQDVWTIEGSECLFDPGDCDDTDCPDGSSGQCTEDHGTGGGACQCLTTITPSAPTAGSSCELGASGACAGMDCPSGSSGSCTVDRSTGGGSCQCLTTPSSRRLRWFF